MYSSWGGQDYLHPSLLVVHRRTFYGLLVGIVRVLHGSDFSVLRNYYCEFTYRFSTFLEFGLQRVCVYAPIGNRICVRNSSDGIIPAVELGFVADFERLAFVINYVFAKFNPIVVYIHDSDVTLGFGRRRFGGIKFPCSAEWTLSSDQ